MGTNYYIRTGLCPTCARYDNTHIGKQSCGWAFCFDPFFPDYKTWLKFLTKRLNF